MDGKDNSFPCKKDNCRRGARGHIISISHTWKCILTKIFQDNSNKELHLSYILNEIIRLDPDIKNNFVHNSKAVLSNLRVQLNLYKFPKISADGNWFGPSSHTNNAKKKKPKNIRSKPNEETNNPLRKNNVTSSQPITSPEQDQATNLIDIERDDQYEDEEVDVVSEFESNEESKVFVINDEADQKPAFGADILKNITEALKDFPMSCGTDREIHTFLKLKFEDISFALVSEVLNQYGDSFLTSIRINNNLTIWSSNRVPSKRRIIRGYIKCIKKALQLIQNPRRFGIFGTAEEIHSRFVKTFKLECIELSTIENFLQTYSENHFPVSKIGNVSIYSLC